MSRARAARRLVPIALLVLVAAAGRAAPSAAQLGSTPSQRAMFGAASPAEVRARLRAHADSVQARDPVDAGEAWHWIGVSHLRAGQADSAAAAFREAAKRRDPPDDALALAEALLATRRAADAESACRIVAALPPDDPSSTPVESRLWRAWARARLTGAQDARPALDEARRALVSPFVAPALRERWSRRFAPMLLEAHAGAWEVLAPLALASRGRDELLLRQALEAAAAQLGGGSFEDWLAAGLARADTLAWSAVRAAGGRPLTLRGAGGFPLRAALLPASAPRAPLLVLVSDHSAAPWAAADSFATQMRRAGFALVFLDARGSGASVGTGCALADDWSAREDARSAAVARDLSAALDAALATGRCDPQRIAVGALGVLAPAAARAARDDARVRAVVFVGASLSPVDRGPFAATLAASGVPGFFQTGAAAVEDNWVVDAIVARLEARATRVAESSGSGSGLALFRSGPAEANRLSDWLRWTWSRPRATPRSRPR